MFSDDDPFLDSNRQKRLDEADFWWSPPGLLLLFCLATGAVIYCLTSTAR